MCIQGQIIPDLTILLGKKKSGCGLPLVAIANWYSIIKFFSIIIVYSILLENLLGTYKGRHKMTFPQNVKLYSPMEKLSVLK